MQYVGKRHVKKIPESILQLNLQERFLYFSFPSTIVILATVWEDLIHWPPRHSSHHCTGFSFPLQTLLALRVTLKPKQTRKIPAHSYTCRSPPFQQTLTNVPLSPVTQHILLSPPPLSLWWNIPSSPPSPHPLVEHILLTHIQREL